MGKIFNDRAFELLRTAIIFQAVKDLDYAGERLHSAKVRMTDESRSEWMREDDRKYYLRVLKRYLDAECFLLSDDYQYLNTVDRLDPYEVIRVIRKRHNIKKEDLKYDTR